MPKVRTPTYREILNYIETNGVRDENGKYAIPEHNMFGILAPLREQPSECFTVESAVAWEKEWPGHANNKVVRKKITAFYKPKPDTREYHAATCLRLSKLVGDNRFFPAEAMRHLRLTAGETETPTTLTDPIPVVKIIEVLGRASGGKHLAEKMRRHNYPLEKRANKWYCQRADAMAMFSNSKHKEKIKEI